MYAVSGMKAFSFLGGIEEAGSAAKKLIIRTYKNKQQKKTLDLYAALNWEDLKSKIFLTNL